MYRHIGVIKSAGIELRGMKASLAPRRQQIQNPKLEKYNFIPYENNQPLIEDSEQATLQALTVIIQTVIENSSGAMKIKVVEDSTERPFESVLAPIIKNIIEQEPMLAAEVTLVSNGAIDTTSLEASDIKHVVKDVNSGPFAQDAHLVVASDVLLYKKQKVLTNSVASVKEGGFILLEELKSSLNTNLLGDLEIISKLVTNTKIYILLRRPIIVPMAAPVLQITENNFSWVEPLKDEMKKAETSGDKIYLFVQGELLTGIIGMVNCLKQEPGGSNIRAVFIQDKNAPKFDLKTYEPQMKKDLIHNVLKNNVWGCYRHIPLEYYNDSGKLQVEHAYINTLTRGDLASLRWIEGPLGYYKYVLGNSFFLLI